MDVELAGSGIYANKIIGLECSKCGKPTTPAQTDWEERLVKKGLVGEPFPEFEIWEKQGRTEEQIYGVVNFLAGQGGIGIERLLAQARKEERKLLREKIEGMKDEHEQDQEVYENSSGGIICANCAAGEYSKEYKEDCPTEKNKVLEVIFRYLLTP